MANLHLMIIVAQTIVNKDSITFIIKMFLKVCLVHNSITQSKIREQITEFVCWVSYRSVVLTWWVRTQKGVTKPFLVSLKNIKILLE